MAEAVPRQGKNIQSTSAVEKPTRVSNKNLESQSETKVVSSIKTFHPKDGLPHQDGQIGHVEPPPKPCIRTCGDKNKQSEEARVVPNKKILAASPQQINPDSKSSGSGNRKIFAEKSLTSFKTGGVTVSDSVKCTGDVREPVHGRNMPSPNPDGPFETPAAHTSKNISQMDRTLAAKSNTSPRPGIKCNQQAGQLRQAPFALE